MVKKPRLFIALCTLPALILTIVFMIVPMVNAIYLSFTSSTALSVGFNSKFVFLDNYKYMFQDKDFLQALFNTLKLMLVIPAVTIFLSLVFAFILTQGQLKEKSFYRTVFFFPSREPPCSRSIGTTYILSLSGTINLSFTLSNVMTGGGPNGASSVLLQYMYTQGMRNANFGYAMAIAMFTLILAIVLAMISKKVSSEKE